MRGKTIVSGMIEIWLLCRPCRHTARVLFLQAVISLVQFSSTVTSVSPGSDQLSSVQFNSHFCWLVFVLPKESHLLLLHKEICLLTYNCTFIKSHTAV